MTTESPALKGLDPDDRQVLVGLMGREPEPVEEKLCAVMWSEHTSYRHSKATLKRFRAEGGRVAVGPGENAGVLDIGGGLLVALRIESHNHPSAVEPFQGAATGLGGILRDILSVGARPIAFLDGLFFGVPGRGRNDYLAQGIVAGVSHYGNSVGVPTPGGHTTFDAAYDGSPLLNAMCIGLVRKDRLVRGAFNREGDVLILLGAPTGRDGLAGAAFASRKTALDEDLRPQVQIGDPFQGKLLTEAVLEMVDEGLVAGLGDLGAAGLTSAVSELAHRGGLGARLDLDAVPVREADMAPEEILLSETQERMILAVHPKDVARILDIADRWGLHRAVVGEVTDDGLFTALFAGRRAVHMPASILADGAPAQEPARSSWKPPVPRRGWRDRDFDEVVGAWLSGPLSMDRRPIFERYDDRVGLRTVLGPGRDALLLRIPEAGQVLAATLDARPSLVREDPRRGAIETVLEAARNLAATGARTIGLVDCLNFGDPDVGEVGESFVRAVEGIAQAALELGLPIVGGNVSFYNGSPEHPVAPTPVIGAVGLLDEGIAPEAVRAEEEASHVFLLGPEPVSEVLPEVDFEAERAYLEMAVALRRERLAATLADVSEGGLFAAVVELSDRTGRGISLKTPKGASRMAFWHSEGGPRYLVTAYDPVTLVEVVRGRGLDIHPIGRMGGDTLRVDGGCTLPVERIRQIRSRSLWDGEREEP